MTTYHIIGKRLIDGEPERDKNIFMQRFNESIIFMFYSVSSYLIWNDSFVSTDRVSELKPYQRLNHFPGMGEISRKDCLARNLAK